MAQDKALGLALAGGFIVFGITWIATPWLQSADAKSETRASVEVERARRLLHAYHAGLSHKQVLLNALREAEIEVDAKDPAALAEKMGDAYQQKHTALWQGYSPTNWLESPPRSERATYGNLPAQIREGVASSTKLMAENEKLLPDALSSVNAALADAENSEIGESLAEAYRLKGTILYYIGVGDALRACVRRLDAEPHRRALASIASRAAALRGSLGLVEGSGIESQIAALTTELSVNVADLQKDQAELTKLNEVIANLENKLQAAKKRAAEARTVLDEIRAKGINLTDPKGAESFAQEFEKQDKVYRAALREIQALEHGTLPSARLDASGDYIQGRYAESDGSASLLSFGLSHYKGEGKLLSDRIQGKSQAIEDLRSDIERLVMIKGSLSVEQTEANVQLPKLAAVAESENQELIALEIEAIKLEDGALVRLDQAANLFLQAAKAAADWRDTARERIEGLSEPSKQRSAFQARTDDTWMSGHIMAQVADARLAQGWIYYDRCRSLLGNAEVFAKVQESLPITNADPDGELDSAQEPRTRGVEVVKKAMNALASAHKEADKHWTFSAQAAGTSYLLVLFGDESYREDTVEAYRNALKGRENKAFAEPFAARLKKLETQ